MKYGKIMTAMAAGISAHAAEVEVSLLSGLPAFEVSGLGDKAVREAQLRVRSALRNSNFEFPKGRVIVGLTPAWLKKTGSAFDLALALAILRASSQIIVRADADRTFVFGELGLDGRLQALPGLYLMLQSAKQYGAERAIIPVDNLREAAQIPELTCLPVRDLQEAADVFCGLSAGCARAPFLDLVPGKKKSDGSAAMAVLSGQKLARQAMVVAAAGWHHLVILGAPGCGKSLLARSLPSILPPLDADETGELRRLYSAASQNDEHVLLGAERPFLELQQSVSPRALIGGGKAMIPGLCSLAHRGVLFLDELMEFIPAKLDLLRQAMEEGKLDLVAEGRVESLPADFLLIAAANPCRCGYALEGGKLCRCRDGEIRRYLDRLSGPLWDRFQMMLSMRQLNANELESMAQAEVPERLEELISRKDAVACAWERQYQRCRKKGMATVLNGRMQDFNLRENWSLSATFVEKAAAKAASMQMSARGMRHILALCRTLADLQAQESPSEEHLLQAFQFRTHPWRLLGFQRAGA